MCVTSWLPPPYYHHHPVPYSSLFTRLPTGVVVWERRGAETARAGGVCWGAPEPNRASSPPLFKWQARLYSRDRSLPRACTPVSSRVHEGRMEGIPCCQRREPSDPWSGQTVHVIRQSGQDARPTSPVEHRGQRGRRSRCRSHHPSCPGPQRGACAAARLCPYLDPSFTNPAAWQGHQITCLFWTLYPLWTLLFYYFCAIKASLRTDATPTVSVVCSSRHKIDR